jgi:hypothetical protein
MFNWNSACYNTMNIDNFSQEMLGQFFSLPKENSCEMAALVDLVAGNAEWPSGGLASRCRIGASGAQLSRIAVHREARFYKNSRTSIYNNKNE